MKNDIPLKPGVYKTRDNGVATVKYQGVNRIMGTINDVDVEWLYSGHVNADMTPHPHDIVSTDWSYPMEPLDRLLPDTDPKEGQNCEFTCNPSAWAVTCPGKIGYWVERENSHVVKLTRERTIEISRDAWDALKAAIDNAFK